MSAPRHHQADVVLRDGSTVHVRPVRAEDAGAVRAFFERLSPRSIALRFFCGFPDLDRAVRWATEVDQHHYGLIATGADGRVVAHAGWELEPDRPERAETTSNPSRVGLDTMVSWVRTWATECRCLAASEWTRAYPRSRWPAMVSILVIVQDASGTVMGAAPGEIRGGRRGRAGWSGRGRGPGLGGLRRAGS